MSELKSLDFGAIQKERYAINGNEDMVLELNTHDFLIMERLKEVISRIEEIEKKVTNIEEVKYDDSVEEISNYTEELISINKDLADMIDYLFDSNVCEVINTSGSLFDVYNGQFKFEIIIETLINLYEDTIQAEYKKRKKRMEKHTSKYIKKSN